MFETNLLCSEMKLCIVPHLIDLFSKVNILFSLLFLLLSFVDVVLRGALQPPRAAADSFARDRDRDSDDRIRRLEAENLRLRFRVADLEGQVGFFFWVLFIIEKYAGDFHAPPSRIPAVRRRSALLSDKQDPRFSREAPRYDIVRSCTFSGSSVSSSICKNVHRTYLMSMLAVLCVLLR